MSWLRTPKPFKGSEICFQALTWKAYDYEDQFHITCCGCDEIGNSVAVTFNDFHPRYFVKVKNPSRIKTELDNLEKTLTKVYKDNFISISIYKLKQLYPFTNGEKFNFFELRFATLKHFKWSSKKLKSYGYELYESNIDPFIRFCHIKNINTAGWIKLEKFIDDKTYSRCTYNISASFKDVIPLPDKQAVAPFILGSYDIECDSEATRIRNKDKFILDASNEDKRKLATIFPDATKNGDKIKIICTTLWKYGTDEYFKHAIAIAPCEESETTADCCVVVENEKELIQEWFKFIRNYDPDVIMGWNIYGFDDEYLFKRLVKYNLENLLEDAGRIINIEGSMKDQSLVSSAYGTNFFRIMDIPGIYKVDLYVWFKKETKLESYKLDRVAEHFLGENKIDLLPVDLFFKMNIDKDKMAECVKYCVQDTLLPLRLTHKRMIFINLIGMANITRVPIEWLITRGQQIKVFSQITYETRQAGVLVPAWDIKEDSDEKFLGATVLHANKGAYFEAVSGLDFASLYPSIMISNNLCYSTMILPEDLPKYQKVEGLNIENIKWMQKNDETEEMEEHSYHYVQNIGSNPHEGILPRILDKLWKQRKSVKKLMKQAAKNNDHTLEGIYNATQLAIKVSMNSVYGFTGATRGFLPMKPIASSVTAKGRKLIEITKDFCEKNYECEVVYGDTDSCYVKFVARDDNGNILKPKDKGYMQKIFDLSEHAAQACNVNLYRKPVELEFEKVMYPFFLFTKKRYAYVEWVDPNKSDHLDAKGIHLVRRDVCAYVQDVSKQVLNTMFYETDVTKALSQAHKAIGDLLSGKVEAKKLQLSKSLRTGYKCSVCHTQEVNNRCNCHPNPPTINLPHVQLAKRLRLQNAIDPPVPGERVPFVFVEGSGLQHERVEHPELLGDKQIDGLYYLDHQLKVPLETLFELVLTPENGYPHGVSHLFEKGLHANTIKYLKDNEKIKEATFKLNQRTEATRTFSPGMRVKRKIKANEFVEGTIEKIDIENTKLTIILDNGKKCSILPDTISRL
tara:strand:- start:1721 stop:4789 length:3069 start_codon:yes stop_codon:yes gene_type:complete